MLISIISKNILLFIKNIKKKIEINFIYDFVFQYSDLLVSIMFSSEFYEKLLLVFNRGIECCLIFIGRFGKYQGWYKEKKSNAFVH